MFCLFSFLHEIVKYLKEVTPYFRKASLLAELGWDLQKEYMPVTEGNHHHVNQNGDGGLHSLGPLPGPPPDSSYSRSDTRCVPLSLSLLATNFKHHDPGKPILYIHLCTGQVLCVIRRILWVTYNSG